MVHDYIVERLHPVDGRTGTYLSSSNLSLIMSANPLRSYASRSDEFSIEVGVGGTSSGVFSNSEMCWK
jgi:hypothetical protein